MRDPITQIPAGDSSSRNEKETQIIADGAFAAAREKPNAYKGRYEPVSGDDTSGLHLPKSQHFKCFRGWVVSWRTEIAHENLAAHFGPRGRSTKSPLSSLKDFEARERHMFDRVQNQRERYRSREDRRDR